MLLRLDATAINVAQSSDVHARHIFINGMELGRRSLPYDRDLTVLHRLGLISQFTYNAHVIADKSMPYVDAVPTTFGVMLFAVAHNKIDSWRSFNSDSYESAIGIQPLTFFANTLENLCNVSGMRFKADEASQEAPSK